MMVLREGVWQAAEEQADEMLAEYRRDYQRRYGINTVESKQFILSPDQLEMRQKREYCVEHPQDIIPGLFVRAWNPMARTRPRSHKNLSSTETLEFDSRLPSLAPTPLGWSGDQWPRTSPCWAVSAPQGLNWHLTTGQRCRIRRMYQQVGPGLAREALKNVLADKYGVPPWVISRVAITSRRCHT